MEIPKPRWRNFKENDDMTTLRTLNLEEGLPYVKDALQILEQEFIHAKNAKIKALKLIHGYGSTGVGGKIRKAVLNLLTEKKIKNQITDFVPGDQWSIFNATTRGLIDTCPEVSKDKDLEKCNIGMTIVIL
jgi:hypothetical protein